jgi:2-hydroxychromene-2-carboxylate isomerase
VGDKRFVAGKRMLSEARRKLTGQAHVVSAFLQIDDPYSYLLSHYLPSLAEHYDIDLRVFLSQALGEEFQPAPGLQAAYAVDDCARLARELGVPFLDKGSLPPTEHRASLSDAVAAQRDSEGFATELFSALAAYWRGDGAAVASMCSASAAKVSARDVIADSQKILRRLGHYNGAMLHYAGEWYWGVDRLHYLTARLGALGVAKSDTTNPKLASIKQAMQYSLPVRPPTAAKDLPAIEYFHSPRSPYSYLALKRLFAIADAFGVAVKIRPVLPMVMRGMQVPASKLRYIADDTHREARRLGVPFGKLADPVGAGTERFMAVFSYAQGEHRERDFVLNAGVGIWSQAIDIATDQGMRKITGRCGLFWPDVEAVMKNDDWRPEIEANRESMMSSGAWGVPTIRIGDFVVWGQDRDWMLVRHLEEMCDTGDGILV